MRQMPRTIGLMTLAVLLTAFPATAPLASEDRDLEGLVELIYRNVSQEGSTARYEEDFDGLDTGFRLSKLAVDWRNIDSGLLDFLHVDATGLGGDPYERASVRLGLKDTYELNVSHWKQSYLYDLFEAVEDLDGSAWRSKRRMTDIDLTWHLSKGIDLFFEMQDVRRDGTSLFMKDIYTDLFLLETPLDQDLQRYSVGGRFELGRADLLIRQTLRRYDYSFNNTTEGDAGLSPTDMVSLESYDWRQKDRGEADVTTITVNLPLGDRFHLTASAYGTLVGEESLESHVSLNADGASFLGPFNVDGGTSDADIEADYLLLDADLSVNIFEPLDFHLQVRSLDRETTSSHLRDLDGNGVPDDTEGIVLDDTPGSVTSVDYALQSITGLFDYAPSSMVRIRAGYRTVDRDLTRSGFEFDTTDDRNTDFESSGDDTLVLGLIVKPIKWLRFSADYEQDDVEQPFTATAPMETDRLRVRATIKPTSDMRLDLGYLDYDSNNDGADFRQAGSCPGPGGDIDDGCWLSSGKSSTYSASFWHKTGKMVDYWLRWAQHDFDRVTRVHYDLDPFGIAENGDSIFASDSTEWAGHVNFSWAERWQSFLRFRINDSSGANDLAGPLFVNGLIIDQDFSDVEAGLTYTFGNGFYVGGRYRIFDYDDFNDRMDYDGEILTLLAGLSF